MFKRSRSSVNRSTAVKVPTDKIRRSPIGQDTTETSDCASTLVVITGLPFWNEFLLSSEILEKLLLRNQLWKLNKDKKSREWWSQATRMYEI